MGVDNKIKLLQRRVAVVNLRRNTSAIMLSRSIPTRHIFIWTILALLPIDYALAADINIPKWNSKFTPTSITVHIDSQIQVLLEISTVDTVTSNYAFQLRSGQPALMDVVSPRNISINEFINSRWQGNVTIDAIFLGSSNVTVTAVELPSGVVTSTLDEQLKVIIIRKTRIIDHIFIGSVAFLVSILYINFGAALDLNVLRSVVGRPIGPAIGFVTQFLVMPILSYLLGVLLFPESVEMQIGLFFTGVSPSGGASNMWTAILDGNINLSILMTTIGNFAAFFTMPFWLFTLGSKIFERANMRVPYSKIATVAISLVLPLGIGLIIQRKCPRVARIMVRLLKPASAALIMFIIIFATVTNLYLFQLFSWQIVVAGLALPLTGYVLSMFLARILRQNYMDALTIAIETGIQNTGVSIFLLGFILPQPEADLTTVIPVVVAIMTPLPLLTLLLVNKQRGKILDGLPEEEQREEQRIYNSINRP